jgi:hypothetical protein
VVDHKQVDYKAFETCGEIIDDSLEAFRLLKRKPLFRHYSFEEEFL